MQMVKMTLLARDERDGNGDDGGDDDGDGEIIA